MGRRNSSGGWEGNFLKRRGRGEDWACACDLRIRINQYGSTVSTLLFAELAGAVQGLLQSVESLWN